MEAPAAAAPQPGIAPGDARPVPTGAGSGAASPSATHGGGAAQSRGRRLALRRRAPPRRRGRAGAREPAAASWRGPRCPRRGARRRGRRGAGTGGGGLTSGPVLERRADGEGGREAVRVLVGDRPGRGDGLGEAAVPVVRRRRAAVPVVVERDERAGRGAVSGGKPSVAHRPDHTRPPSAVCIPRPLTRPRPGDRLPATGPRGRRERRSDRDGRCRYAARPGACPMRATSQIMGGRPHAVAHDPAARAAAHGRVGDEPRRTRPTATWRGVVRAADTRVRVLVADGDPGRVGAIVHVLGEAGMEAVTAYRGASALARVTDEAPDLVIVGDRLGDGPADRADPAAARPGTAAGAGAVRAPGRQGRRGAARRRGGRRDQRRLPAAGAAGADPGAPAAHRRARAGAAGGSAPRRARRWIPGDARRASASSASC